MEQCWRGKRSEGGGGWKGGRKIRRRKRRKRRKDEEEVEKYVLKERAKMQMVLGDEND